MTDRYPIFTASVPWIRHGETKGRKPTKLYIVWSNMMQRCFYQKNSNYKYYGGRGITVCEQWRTASYFFEWARTNGYSDKLTIDRIDNNGDYCPKNCRWVSQRINIQNRNSFIGGSCFHNASGKFMARIVFNKKPIYLGLFTTKAEGDTSYVYAASLAECGIEPHRFKP